MTWQWVVVGLVVVYAVLRLVMGIRKSVGKGGNGGCAGCALAEQCGKRKDEPGKCDKRDGGCGCGGC